MTDFQLDTSGAIPTPSCPAGWTFTRWSDLTPFVQGYVEAVFAGFVPPSGDYCRACRGSGMWHCADPSRVGESEGCGQRVSYAFSDLAPATLVRIIADCELRGRSTTRGVGVQAEDGRIFWAERQAGDWSAFPPLTVSLSDDGKVVFGEAA